MKGNMITVANILSVLEMTYPTYRIYETDKNGETNIIADETTAFTDSEPTELMNRVVDYITPVVTDEGACLDIYLR